MPDRTEDDSSSDGATTEGAVPRRHEMMGVMVSLVPFEPDASFRIVEIGSGEGLLAAALLERFARATLLALDGSPSMREATKRRTAPFADRAQVRAFDLATLDWWDSMRGAGLVVSSLCVHHLNDAKKQYLYKAVAERLSPPGAFLVADVVDAARPGAPRSPGDHASALLHHLIWLKHAGFASVDCFWMFAGHAVFGGFT